MVEVSSDCENHRIRQLAVFLPNRLGALLSLYRSLDAANIKILGVTVVDAADHAVARLVVDQPTLAAQVLKNGGYSFVESELLGVAFGQDIGIRRVLTAVLAAEVNIHYVYALLVSVRQKQVLAAYVDDPAAAARLLTQRGLELIDQGEFSSAAD